MERQRNTVQLIGKFQNVIFEGEQVNVMIFKDRSFGGLSIGVLNDEPIELNVHYQVTAALYGKEKIYSDGRVFYTNFLNLISYEKTNKTEEYING